MKKYIIGLDGGASKTVAKVFTIKGEEVFQTKSGFANFSVDETTTKNNIIESLQAIFKIIDYKDVEIAVLGIAGYSNYKNKNFFKEELIERFKIDFHLTTDAEIALYSVKKISHKDTLMILSGTGSAIVAEKSNLIRIFGGYGHILGDEGSAYHFVISAFKSMISQYETDNFLSDFNKKILELIDGKDIDDIKSFIYQRKKSEIAEISEKIVSLMPDFSNEIEKLLLQEAHLLQEQALRACKWINSKDIVLGFKGSFIEKAPMIKEKLIESLASKNIIYEIDGFPEEPVIGAFYLAKLQQEKR